MNPCAGSTPVLSTFLALLKSFLLLKMTKIFIMSIGIPIFANFSKGWYRIMPVKHVGNKWQIDVYTKGARRRISGFVTKKEALQFERVLLNESDGLPDSTGITVNNLWEEWHEAYLAGGVTESTQYKVDGFFGRHIQPKFGKRDISTITSQELQVWINKGSLKWRSFNKNAHYFKRIFDYAIKIEYLENNPFDKVSMPRKKSTPEKSVWTSEEYEKWLNYLLTDLWEKSKQQSVYLVLLTKTGMRRQEISALNVNDINLRKRTLSINKALKYGKQGMYLGETKTKDSKRDIGLDKNTIEMLKVYLRDREYAHQKLFTTGSEDIYMSFNRPYKWFKQAIKEAGVPDIGGLHALRHEYATMAIRKGISPKLVQKQLGHSDVSITMDIYNHVSNNEVIGIADIFEQ